ncbi:inorganic phosphate transporter [Burkholderia cenocepacia]|uniref:inorganic phosphate transporter n=1 Tax=Burkholderia cenocepacia TaxID=95486 RepID=UPI00264E646E|nr:inorganic phosphate transporter [Burkholderia cenocepacia]MDN7681626.1 inorganic phosphate transporter [Burkholderia cenocepacia]
MMTAMMILFLATVFLSYSNGANDNFKGVATLYGSGVASYRTAITVATVATIAGSLCSLVLASGLAQAFSGKGLVPPAISGSPNFLLSVALGAGATVILATFLGFPVSTTHGLTGGLVGAGFVALGHTPNLSVLGSSFLLPLVFSPIAAVALTIPLYKGAHIVAERSGAGRTLCMCVAPARFVPVGVSSDGSAMMQVRGGIEINSVESCVYKYDGYVFGVSTQKLVDVAHYASAIALSFARGLNDTPKIAGLLLVVKWLDIRWGVVVVAVGMTLGGIVNAKRVAETMSKKISRMNDGQALTANLVTAVLVIFASKLGLPVSTTHVSVGAITGVGVVNGTANVGVLKSILLSWVLTLPMAALLSAACYYIFM